MDTTFLVLWTIAVTIMLTACGSSCPHPRECREAKTVCTDAHWLPPTELLDEACRHAAEKCATCPWEGQ